MKNLNKRQMILLGALVVLLVYYLISSGIFSTKDIVQTVQKLTDRERTVSDEQVVEDIQKYTQMAVAEIEWVGDWTGDPFFYVAPETLGGQSDGLLDQLFGSGDGDGMATFELSGISWHGNTGFALINGEPVGVGEAIGGYIVDKIAFNYVLLTQGKQTIRLTINEY